MVQEAYFYDLEWIFIKWVDTVGAFKGFLPDYMLDFDEGPHSLMAFDVGKRLLYIHSLYMYIRYEYTYIRYEYVRLSRIASPEAGK